MPREAEPSLNEKNFVVQALQENLRLDGRELDQYRPLELTFGDEYGVANVSLGKTKYALTITSQPQFIRLNPNISFPPEEC